MPCHHNHTLLPFLSVAILTNTPKLVPLFKKVSLPRFPACWSKGIESNEKQINQNATKPDEITLDMPIFDLENFGKLEGKEKNKNEKKGNVKVSWKGTCIRSAVHLPPFPPSPPPPFLT